MDSAIEALLDAFPKRRPPLSPAQQAIALEAQKINREGRNWATKASRSLEKWMHRRVAAGTKGEILEIGAGTLNHLPFERGAAAYDAIEPEERLYADSPMREQIRGFYPDITEVPRDRRYDKIVSVAVLEHLTELPMCFARAALLLKDDGVFQAGIPSEGALLWSLAWRTTTGIAFHLRTGLDYGERMRHEHVNTAREIIALAQYFYRRTDVRLFPLPLFHLSLYHYLEAREPHLDRARGYLDRRGVAV
jgi:SAM-dependent methyltransferase